MDLRKRLGIALLAIASPALLFAQVDLGDIAVTGANGSGLAILRPATGQVTVHSLGTLPGPVRCSLWDPRRPQSFIIGGQGFVARSTFDASGQITSSVITNLVGDITGLAWETPEILLAFDATALALRRIDPITGIRRRYSDATDPWPHGGSGLAANADSGEVFLAGHDLWRLTPTAFAPLASGCGGDQDRFEALAIDELSNDVFGLHTHLARLVRVDPLGTMTDVSPPGTWAGASALDLVPGGDLVVGQQSSLHLVSRVTGTSVLLGQLPATLGAARSISVAGRGRPFLLEVSGRPDHGVHVAMRNVPLGSSHGWLLTSAATNALQDAGPAAGLVPDDLAWSIVSRHPQPQVDHPWHWISGIPGQHPNVPHDFAPGTTANVTGMTFDFVSVTLTTSGQVVDRSNLVRVTF